MANQADIVERRHGVARLEVFGSAARSGDFDPIRSDADFPVTFEPAIRNELGALVELVERDVKTVHG